MMPYKITIGMFRSSNSDTDFFYIDAGVFQGDTLGLFLFMKRLDYLQRMSLMK